MSVFEINNSLSLADVEMILSQSMHIALSVDTQKRIMNCRDFLDNKMRANDSVFYGINTGFGSLCNTQISTDELEQLQYKGPH